MKKKEWNPSSYLGGKKPVMNEEGVHRKPEMHMMMKEQECSVFPALIGWSWKMGEIYLDKGAIEMRK